MPKTDLGEVRPKIDESLNETSKNPVQNKVITEAINELNSNLTELTTIPPIFAGITLQAQKIGRAVKIYVVMNRNASITTPTKIAQLPDEYRPSGGYITTISFSCIQSTLGKEGVGAERIISINQSGEMYLSGYYIDGGALVATLEYLSH